jgi:arylsulfatase A-like enzyme
LHYPQLVTKSLQEPLPEPFFLFYHLIDTHSDWRELPYEAPEPFRSRFVAGDVSDILTEWNGLKATEYLAAANRGDTKFEENQIRYFNALYDSSVAYVDHHLGRFFDWLRAHDLYHDSLIILTSDHGGDR